MVSADLGRPWEFIYREWGNMGNAARLCAAGLLLGSVGAASAGTLTTVRNTSAADLANALTTGGAGGSRSLEKRSADIAISTSLHPAYFRPRARIITASMAVALSLVMATPWGMAPQAR